MLLSAQGRRPALHPLRHAHPAELIHHREDAEGAPILQPCRDKIHSPTLVRPRGERHDHRVPPGDFLPQLAPDGQTFLGVDPVGVHKPALLA